MLGESAYECKWFCLAPEKAKNFVFIILRSRKPRELTAAKFYVINMQKFGSVSKQIFSIYAYINSNKINSKTLKTHKMINRKN